MISPQLLKRLESLEAEKNALPLHIHCIDIKPIKGAYLASEEGITIHWDAETDELAKDLIEQQYPQATHDNIIICTAPERVRP